MERMWYFRLVVTILVLGIGLYVLYPSYFYYYEATEEQKNDNTKFCEALPSFFSCMKFNLGLDLQGGVHLVMGVQTDKALEQRADRLADALREALTEQKLAYSRVDRPRNTASIVLSLAPDTDAEAVDKYLRKDFGVLMVDRREGKVWTLEIVPEEAKYIRDGAVDQAIKTIRNRADQFGVTEPTIARRGTDNILIQLPGVKDPDRAIENIGKTAQLEFKIVDDEGTAVFDEIKDEELPAGVTRDTYAYDGPEGKRVREVFFKVPEGKKEEMLVLLTPRIPSNREIGFGEVENQAPDAKVKLLRTYLLNTRPGITGDYLTNANVQQNPDLPTDYYVTMSFDTRGGKIFEKLTEENTLRRMAVVLDDKVNSAPVIQEKIGGGTARITLGSGIDPQKKFNEARDLTLVLKAGALPAPVELREKRQVGETLGAEAIEKGSFAALIGFLLIVLFMAIYYSLSGVLADFALALNLVLMLAALSLFEATLTLPGIAGMLLTLAMAVDSNVLIFERIREELRLGKTARAAVVAGYDKAWRTIFDSNVTTLIAGVVLLQYGSGPIRGFAVTLIIGLLISMFTAITVTRLVYDFVINVFRVKTLSV